MQHNLSGLELQIQFRGTDFQSGRENHHGTWLPRLGLDRPLNLRNAALLNFEETLWGYRPLKQILYEKDLHVSRYFTQNEVALKCIRKEME